MTHSTTDFRLPIFSFWCFGASLPIPFLRLTLCTVYKVAGGLSFSVISCSLFKLFSQAAWELCSLWCALGFYREVLAIRRDNSLAWSWRSFPRLVPSCARWSLCSPPAAEWRSCGHGRPVGNMMGRWQWTWVWCVNLHCRVLFKVPRECLLQQHIYWSTKGAERTKQWAENGGGRWSLSWVLEDE